MATNDWYRVLFCLIAIVALLFMVWPRAKAQERTITLTWTKPERNCDGTLLTNLKGFRAYWGKGFADMPSPTLTTYTTPLLPPGAWWVALTAYNTTGEESPLAGPVQVTIPAETLTVTQPTVYTVVKGTDRFLTLPVGTVPLGVKCDVAQTVNGYYAVPRTSVTWSGSVKPVVVVAKCD